MAQFSLKLELGVLMDNYKVRALPPIREVPGAWGGGRGKC